MVHILLKGTVCLTIVKKATKKAPFLKPHWMKPRKDWCLEPTLSIKVPFVRFDPSDWRLPGNDQSVSNLVFFVSSYFVIWLPGPNEAFSCSDLLLSRIPLGKCGRFQGLNEPFALQPGRWIPWLSSTALDGSEWPEKSCQAGSERCLEEK